MKGGGRAASEAVRRVGARGRRLRAPGSAAGGSAGPAGLRVPRVRAVARGPPRRTGGAALGGLAARLVVGVAERGDLPVAPAPRRGRARRREGSDLQRCYLPPRPSGGRVC